VLMGGDRLEVDAYAISSLRSARERDDGQARLGGERPGLRVRQIRKDDDVMIIRLPTLWYFSGPNA
jgi:hypothetical protein